LQPANTLQNIGISSSLEQRRRQELTGVCLWDGGLQAVLYGQIYQAARSASDLELARSESSKKSYGKVHQTVLLILDEWLLLKLSEPESKDIFELLHKKKEVVHNFLLTVSSRGWYEQLGVTTARLPMPFLTELSMMHHKINIESIDPSKDISMREFMDLIRD
jgi:hypothetical protein